MEILQPAYPRNNFAGCASRSLRSVTDFIVHHTAGPVTQTALEINAYHVKEGYSGVGYNWIITPDGMVYAGRPLSYIPAASFGRNTLSVAVVLVGNFEKGDKGYTGPPTEKQIQALKELRVYAGELIPSINITIGHRDVGRLYYPKTQGNYATACPGSELYKRIQEIKEYVWSNDH